MSKNFLVLKCQGWLQENARTTCWGTATCSQGTQNDFRGCWATSCGIHQWNSVWVKTSICLPEQHLHSAGSQEVLTSTASDLHGRGNWKNRQMQLSSLKTSQDSEDSVLTLAEQKLQSIFSDPQLQRPEVVTTFSPVPAPSAAAALPGTLGIQKSISFIQNNISMGCCCCHLLLLMEQWALSQCGSCMLDVTAGSYPTREGKTLHRKEMEWERIRNGKKRLNY